MTAKHDANPKVELTTAEAGDVEAEFLAVVAFQEDLANGARSRFGALDARLSGHLARAAREERFLGKPEQALQLSTLGHCAASRLLALGLGSRAGAAAIAHAGFEPLRMAAGQAARAASRAGAARLAFVLPPELETADAVRAVVEGALLGAYRFDRYKSAKEEGSALGALLIALPEEVARSDEAKSAAALGREVAEAVAWTRDRVNEAPAHCTPSHLAHIARELAQASGLRCEVRGRKEIEALGMGMFLGVARGSSEEPQLVKLSWIPKGSAAKSKPLVLVGKAITFDSGGLSLKPTDSMVTMKDDMAGSAAVMAVMKVVAELAPPFPVHALFGACENMPGGRAYKPSDVLTAYDGQTVEITNTDAEGRLVLGDVLAWAVATLAPAALVDVATLTGACVVALGNYTVGTFGADGAAVEAVLAAARTVGEDFWRLPLTEALKDNLKSDVADMKNTGERWGGAIAAAHFLHAFTGETPWAHLDIAGPAYSNKERGYLAKGGTGVAVRTLVELVRTWRAPDEAAPTAPAKRKARGKK